MSDEVLEKYVIEHINSVDDELVMFSWHGGEPLLAGINFYRRVVELQKKHNTTGKNIINGVQTNGTLIDDEWAAFFASENFIAGISIDGPREFHDSNRVHPNAGGSHGEAEKGLRILQNNGVPVEILCVVSSYNSHAPLEIYKYFKSLGARFITFLPLVIKDLTKISKVTDSSVRAADFGKFLSVVFDNWLENDIGKINVQIFDEAFSTVLKPEHSLCIFKKVCGRVSVIEKNGDFFSCDHFTGVDYLIGNIGKNSLTELLESDKQKEFGKKKFTTLPKYCLDCEFLEYCNGECPKNRFIESPSGEPGLNYLCEGYKIFFSHCQPFVESLRLASKP